MKKVIISEAVAMYMLGKFGVWILTIKERVKWVYWSAQDQ